MIVIFLATSCLHPKKSPPLEKAGYHFATARSANIKHELLCVKMPLMPAPAISMGCIDYSLCAARTPATPIPELSRPHIDQRWSGRLVTWARPVCEAVSATRACFKFCRTFDHPQAITLCERYFCLV